MSLLVNNTLANPTASFYAALGSGGGGGNSSNLQSPASILPGPTGDLLLSMIATPGPGNNSALVITANGGDAYAFLNAGSGANTAYTIHANNVAAGNYLEIGAQQGIGPMIQLDAPNHTLTLGDNFPVLSQVNLNGASIRADAYVASGGGGLDLTSTGAILKGGTNDGITVTPTQTTIVGNYKYTGAIPTVADGVSYTLTSPAQTGLYSITIDGTSDPVGTQCAMGVLAYFVVGSGYVSGGNTSVVLNGTVGGTQFAQLYTSVGVSGPVINFRFTAAGLPPITGLSYRVIQLTGDLGF